MSNYEKSDQFYEKLDGPVMCGCMGPVHGEPFCPCQMREAGLPLSKDHVEAIERYQAELTAALGKYGWK